MLGRTRLPPILSEWRGRQDYGSFFRCQIVPWKYSYMLGDMVSLCSLAICLPTISEYRKRSPQMRQCHWSPAKMYGRHSELFGSSLGSGILINPVSDAAAQLASAAMRNANRVVAGGRLMQVTHMQSRTLETSTRGASMALTL